MDSCIWFFSCDAFNLAGGILFRLEVFRIFAGQIRAVNFAISHAFGNHAFRLGGQIQSQQRIHRPLNRPQYNFVGYNFTILDLCDSVVLNGWWINP